MKAVFYYRQDDSAKRIVDCFSTMSPIGATPFDTKEQAQAFIDEKLQEFMPSLLSIRERLANIACSGRGTAPRR